MRLAIGMMISSSMFLLAGCPSDGSDPGLLVGTWRQVPTSVETGAPDMLTVKDDGSYQISKSSGLEVGTYEADGRTLTIRSGSGTLVHELSESYVLEGDQLLVGALLPSGSVDGLVARWRGDFEVDGDEAITLDLDVRADGTVHYARDSTKDGHEAFDGTWRQEAGDFITSLVVGTSGVALHWKAITGRAIGSPLYTRVP